MSFHSRLKERREQLKITQVELAHRLGITKGAVGNYETGASSPKAEILLRIFHVLECDANYLFQDEIKLTEKEQISPDEREYLKKYRALDDYGKDLMDTILEKEYLRCNPQTSSPVIREYNKPQSPTILRPVARNGKNKSIILDGNLDFSQIKGIEEEGDDF
ncbi:MAG: helix-turn-helix domain-containing protein [Massiliimalia sp.]|jgi:transcriptional regulator with XRE-family HTH domain